MSAKYERKLGEVALCRVTMAEAISLAKELNDTHSLALALWHAAYLAHYERDPAEVERSVSDLIELSMRHNLAYWGTMGAVPRGWARSASGDTAQGIAWIEEGIAYYRGTGSVLVMSYFLGLKAEALHLAARTAEALETIREAEVMAERSEARYWRPELHRLRGVFLAAMGANETQIEASFCEAINTAREQKSISLAKRAEATYEEYRVRKGKS
jgi:predicted ATPase